MASARKPATVLAIGDEKDFDSYLKFKFDEGLFQRYGFDFASTSYNHLLKGRLPKMRAERVIVFLFFPFSYWDTNIEHEGYRGIYGSTVFLNKFLRFWKKAEKAITSSLQDKLMLFINPPLLCALCRDKVEVAKKLSRAGLPQPRLHAISSIDRLVELLNSGREFFIKPRCGSMGKGITFLSKDSWKTNFTVKGSKIISPLSDYGWWFSNVTGNRAFLKQLLQKDVIVQEAIATLKLKGMKVDLRLYAFFNRILYIYPRKNKPANITTNISQGARGAPRSLHLIPKKQVRKAREVAVAASDALGEHFLGIDIALDKNKRDVYVVDVNAFPGFPKRQTFNLTKRMVETLADLDSSGRLLFKSV